MKGLLQFNAGIYRREIREMKQGKWKVYCSLLLVSIEENGEVVLWGVRRGVHSKGKPRHEGGGGWALVFFLAEIVAQTDGIAEGHALGLAAQQQQSADARYAPDESQGLGVWETPTQLTRCC